MNETQKALLEKGVIVLPNHITHEVYEYVLEALAMRPEQILMYCKGDGGDVSSALAIVDLIQQHGKVVGMLPGEANSSHVTVFAGCSERYVFPNGVIGVHQIAWDSHNGRLDSHNLRLLSVDFDKADTQVARILSAASNKSLDWWYKVLRDTGSGGVTQYRAGQMIQLGLARDVGTFKLTPPQPLPTSQARGEGLENGNASIVQNVTVHNPEALSQSIGVALGKPMVTTEQIEQLGALGYVVVPTDNSYFKAIFDDGIGRNWRVAGIKPSEIEAWSRALEDAQLHGLITDNKASQG